MSTPKTLEQTSGLKKKISKLSNRFSRSMSSFLSGTILSVAGFAVGVLILLYDYPLMNPDEKKFISTPQFKLWLLAVAAQTVFWAVALGSMWPVVTSLSHHARKYKSELLVWVVLFAALIFASTAFAASCPNYNFSRHLLKTRLHTYIGGLVAIVAGVGNVLVNIGLRNILTVDLHASDLQHDEKLQQDLVRNYLNLRSSLLHFLSILGVMLGLVTLSQSAKRNAIIASGACAAEFGAEKVLVFGLYYTLILILVFLPTFSILITTGRKLRDEILPIPSPQNEKWNSWCAKREKLEKILALSVTESLRAAIAVMAPVLGGLIPLIRTKW